MLLVYFLLMGLLSSSVCANNYIPMKVVGELHENLDMSAISCINDLCLVASDETKHLQIVKIDNENFNVQKTKIKLGKSQTEFDIEGLTNDGSRFFAIGSHSLSRKQNKFQLSRYTVFIITPLKGNTGYSVKRSSLIKILSKDKFFAKYYKKSAAENGIDIEGLAYKDGYLYAGFRKPVVNGKAQVLKVNLEELFSKRIPHYTRFELDLLSDRGIRSLEFHRGNLFAVAGATKAKFSSLMEFTEHGDFLAEYKVPYNTSKLEGMEFINNNEVIFFYDSQKNGMPLIHRL